MKMIKASFRKTNFMKKEMYLHIPEPCHENWDRMSAAQQGRFCQSCCKQVVDFTNMSDKQILDVLSKASDKTCGRFAAQQLERPIAHSTPPLVSPYKLFLSAFIPAFLLAGANNAKGQIKGKVAAREVVTEVVTMGLVLPKLSREVKITGKVKDENNQPVAGAFILIEGTQKGTSTDAEGSFSVKFPVGNNQKLKVSCVGYETKETEVGSDHTTPLQIILSNKNNVLQGEVVVGTRCSLKRQPKKNDMIAAPLKNEYKGVVVNEQGDAVPYASVISNSSKGVIADSSGRFKIELNDAKRSTALTASSAGYQSQILDVDLEGNATDLIKFILKSNVLLDTIAVKCDAQRLTGTMMGGLSVVRRATIRDTANTFIQKVFNNELFKAYPNPAAPGSDINLLFKNPGTYAIQLFDNSGRLYQSKQITTEVSKQTTSLLLPLTVTPGMYFLKAVNGLSGKQFIEKIIIR